MFLPPSAHKLSAENWSLQDPILRFPRAEHLVSFGSSLLWFYIHRAVLSRGSQGSTWRPCCGAVCPGVAARVVSAVVLLCHDLHLPISGAGLAHPDHCRIAAPAAC